MNKAIITALAAKMKAKVEGCTCEIESRILKALMEFHPQAHVLAVWRSEVAKSLSIEAFRTIIDKLEHEGYLTLSIVGEDNHCNVFPHLTKQGLRASVGKGEPCSTCAPWRELLEKYLCWHEWDGNNFGGVCIHCHKTFGTCNPDYDSKYQAYPKPDNPDLTTARSPSGTQLLIVSLLKQAGVLEGFITDYVWAESANPRGNAVGDEYLKWLMVERMRKAEILTDGKLLVDAVASYLEVV